MTEDEPSEPLEPARRVCARLDRSGPMQRVELGESNRVWFVDDLVLRMSARPGRSKLRREAQVVTALPAAVGYPAVLGSGSEDGYEWMATARLPGDNLATTWAGLGSGQRELALADLCRRVLAVAGADLARLPPLPPTPIYELRQERARRDLDTYAGLFDPDTLRRLRAILDEGFEAMKLVPLSLVNTDTGPHNAVWDGRSAVPVDFEFATIGPADLDIDGLCRSAIELDAGLLSTVVACLRDPLSAPGAAARLRAYAVLRDLWALGKWVAHSPERHGIETWQPTLDLRAHAFGSSWVSQAIDIGG